ncbi:MAG: nucleotidyltransferase domain-containing protein [Ktedonobacteraceae bacterium]|nr:nucleotidyltransferase domain-containing protein [Ktedonobacteraceae bacterium]
MEQVSQVEHLSCQAIQAFAADPHVYEMFLFGSYEKKTHDRYSDVDLQVVSQNFDATMSQFRRCLSDIGQVLVAFPLVAQVGYAAYMVLFENYPFYTKLDINVSDVERCTPFSTKACVYRRDVIPSHEVSTYQPVLFEEPLNTLYGYYLGAIRYMKYRKRGKHFSAYKFYRAQLDYLLSRWYREVSHEHSIERLGILEYQLLDMREESAVLKRYLYPGNEQTMDMFYIEMLQKIADESQSSLNKEHKKVLNSMLDFLKREAS